MLIGIAKEFQDSKDTSTLTVIVEDSAAIIGLIIAGIGISLSETTGNMIFDSIGSLSIGIILMVFALFLAKENKTLLIGEAISKKDYRRIVELVHKIPKVNFIANNALCSGGWVSGNGCKSKRWADHRSNRIDN
jgi:divalent metal cation (Fe/Co/Zn/Cd) transporter